MATPNDVAAVLANWTGPKSGARYKEFEQAARFGQTYTPGQAAGTAENTNYTNQLRNQVAQNYAGTSQALADQIKAAQDRYGTNKADIKSIFGTLSTIRSADVAKINKQFTDSIAASQQALAQRTAQAQAQLKLGQQGAATAGAELGAGPTQMPTDSLTSQAVAQGIADSNANQSNWAGLMSSMQNQQLMNVDNSITGYNLQSAAALDQLRRDYEDRLLGLQGQQAGIADQIAQGVAGIKGAQASAEYDQQMQALKNKGLTDVANIRADALKAKGGGGATTTPAAKKYTNDTLGLSQQMTDNGLDYNSLSTMISRAYRAVRDANVKAAAGLTPANPTAPAILEAWKRANKKAAKYSQYLPFVEKYLKMTY